MSTPDTNALIERLSQMDLYEFDVPATMNVGSAGYYRSEAGEIAAEALTAFKADNERLTVKLAEKQERVNDLLQRELSARQQVTELEAKLYASTYVGNAIKLAQHSTAGDE